MGWTDGFYDNSWLRLVRHNSSTGAMTVNGSTIPTTDSVATWALLQAIPKTAANDGLIILCEDIGVKGGSLWQYVHSLGDWFNPNPILYHSQAGTEASPIASVAAGITAATKFALAADPTFAADFLTSSSVLRMEAGFNKQGANATCTAALHLGTAGTSSDAQLWSGTIAITTDSDLYAVPSQRFVTTTKILAVRNAVYNTSSSAGTFAELTTNVNTASIMKVSATTGIKHTDDVINMMFLDIWLEKR